MSHFCTLVFHNQDKTVDDLMAPYSEELEVAPYVKYTKQQAIDKVREEIAYTKTHAYAEYKANPEKYKEEHSFEYIKFLEEEFPQRLNWTDEECYVHFASGFDLIEPNGDILSTYNPNAKWDWYEEGGRYDGVLVGKSGLKTNTDYVSEIDWTNFVPFAYVSPNGMWYERGTMGWWAIVSNEKNIDEWKNQFREFVEAMPDKTIVTVVDCHI